MYSIKLFLNFHLSESSFTCPGLQASGLVQRLFKSSVYTGFLFIKGLDRFHYITNMGTGRFGTCDKELQICLLPIWEQVGLELVTKSYRFAYCQYGNR